VYETLKTPEATQELRRRLIDFTSVVIGRIAESGLTWMRVKKVVQENSDEECTIAGIKAYLAEIMGATINDNNDRTFTLRFIHTALECVDWYAVLSYIQNKMLEEQPF